MPGWRSRTWGTASVSAPLFVEQQIANQRNSHVEGRHEDVFKQCGSLGIALVSGVSLGTTGDQHHVEVLQKVDAAVFAGAPLFLLMTARRALVTQGGVAARAETNGFARLALALRTLHAAILGPCDPG
jgi:hypothetical protein